MTGCRYMDKKHKKCPQSGVFSHFSPEDFFFKNQALSLLCPCDSLTLCKKLEKTKEPSLRYLKTDHGPHTNGQTDWHTRTDRGNYIGPPHINRGPKYLKFLTTWGHSQWPKNKCICKSSNMSLEERSHRALDMPCKTKI